MSDPMALVEALVPLSHKAGAVILEVYGREDLGVQRKADDSPVTEADGKAEAVILAGLAELAPGVPVVAEESVAAGRIPDVAGVEAFFLVDPLDGTKSFIKREGEFTVNIALMVGGVPVAGVVHVPVQQATYWGAFAADVPDRSVALRQIGGAAAETIAVRPPPEAGLTVLASRSHGAGPALERFLDRFAVAERISASSSLKFCRVAEGVADLYPRFGPTCEWDTAAGDAVLRAAGGRVTTEDGAPLTYGKGGKFLNPNFIAWGFPPSL
ncbi:MAG: 3'(2'),5'-bisphosphate nucleotidase CysQ [Rhodospirillaceae bacterium]